MVVFTGYCDDIEKAKTALMETIENKTALEKFKEFVRAQNGNACFVDDTSMFELGSIVRDVYIGEENRKNYVQEIVTEDIGMASLELGGGRKDKMSQIDLSVGVVLHKKLGDLLDGKTKIATIYGNDENKVNKAYEIICNAYKIGENKPCQFAVVKKVVDILV